MHFQAAGRIAILPHESSRWPMMPSLQNDMRITIRPTDCQTWMFQWLMPDAVAALLD
jgi:hypothetical protein